MLDGLYKLLLPYWLQLQQQSSNNPRLRWMLWGVLYIFLIYFALSLGEWREAREPTVKQLQRTSVKLEQLENQMDWPQRWAAEKSATEQLGQRLWEADTAGLAEADLQNYLRKLVNDHNGDALQLRLAPTETLMLGGETLFKVSADVSAMIATSRIDSFISAMAVHPQALIVERFGYGAQRSGQMNLLVSAYFIASNQTENSGAKNNPEPETNNVAP